MTKVMLGLLIAGAPLVALTDGGVDEAGERLVNEFLQARLKYEHDRRESNEPGDDFDANMVELSLTLQY